MNKDNICVFGVVSDYVRGLKASKVNDKWSVVKMHFFTLADDKGNKYDTKVLDENCLWDVENGMHICASGSINEQGTFIAGYVDRWGRYCSYCGKHHTEGYHIEGGGEYACSYDCLLGLYHGVYKDMERDIESEDTYWTEWE